MLYLIPGARHAPGTSWKSPYSPHIDMVSVASSRLDDNWQRVDHELSEPQRAVGLWIMADGDNTESIFNSELRNLVID
jgi:hypothetical protein